ncbi:MAG: hypothetical protein ACK5LC_04980 [Coprobacillaceae bacterium]
MYHFEEADYQHLIEKLPELADREHIRKRFQISSHFFTACLRLDKYKSISISTYIPFLNHQNNNIKGTAIYRMRQFNYFNQYKQLLYPLLDSEDGILVRNVLQALIHDVPSIEYIELFRPVWHRFPDNKDAIHSNLKRYLSKMKYPEDYYIDEKI